MKINALSYYINELKLFDADSSNIVSFTDRCCSLKFNAVARLINKDSSNI